MDISVSNDPPPEIWQVDAGGQVYEASFEELTQWIAEGSLLRQDKVRRGNLRWIEAQKVPALLGFFNAKELGVAPPPIVSTTTAQSTTQDQTNSFTSQSFSQNRTFSNYSNNQQNPTIAEIADTRFCLVHIETRPKYICDGCANVFCGECPQSFGGSVKLCPMCGAMCKPIKEAVEKEQKMVAQTMASNEGFGFVDFRRAIVYPFKFGASFIFGALFYLFFTIGQHASALGGRWLISASIICWMLSNMLTFGILANMVENMLQGKINQNFMPSFDDFSLWDDVIHPLFLSIFSYISAFGPFILLCIVMIYFVVSTASETNTLQPNNLLPMTAPELQGDLGAGQQGGDQIKLVKDGMVKKNEEFLKQVQDTENAAEGGEIKQYPSTVRDEEQEFQRTAELIKKTRQQQLESTIGKQLEDQDSMLGDLSSQIFKWAGPFILLAGITFLWGIFYFPVALIVASYTRNIASVINPLVGLDTIKRLGFDYIKILFFGFLLLIVGGIISALLHIILAPFNLPQLGNVPAIAIGSIFTFYLSIVFSTIIGLALYKNLDSFKLYKN